MKRKHNKTEIAMDGYKCVKMAKVKKSIDWALSCLIRLPIITLFGALAVATVGTVIFFIAPENIEKVFYYIGITLPFAR